MSLWESRALTRLEQHTVCWHCSNQMLSLFLQRIYSLLQCFHFFYYFILLFIHYYSFLLMYWWTDVRPEADDSRVLVTGLDWMSYITSHYCYCLIIPDILYCTWYKTVIYSFDTVCVFILCLLSVMTNHTYVHYHSCQSTVQSATFGTIRVIKWSTAKWGWSHRRIFPWIGTWVTKVAADGFFTPMHCEQWTILMVMLMV